MAITVGYHHPGAGPGNLAVQLEFGVEPPDPDAFFQMEMSQAIFWG